MDATVTEYIKILLDILVAAIVSTILLFIARRYRKEKTLVGFKARSKDEKYVGFALIILGAVFIILSVLQLLLLINSNYYSAVPFGLTGIQVTLGNQTTDIISAQLLGLGFGISFWLMVFGYGGRKFVMLGFDLLRGRQVKIIKKFMK
jgi:hypothetical protein